MTGATEERSVSCEVEVEVDPSTAFTAFTEELDLWWVRGPINHHDAGRLTEMRCEGEVGGRLLEVYDEAGGDMLELGRITRWEPPFCIEWQSSVDDVQTEVRFDQTEKGTRVTVLAHIPVGGVDRGGTSWTRTVPAWFGMWCGKRDKVSHEQRDIARLALGVYYERPAAAARWLVDVFGFEATTLPTGEDPLPEGSYGHPWIELRVGNSSLMIFKQEGAAAGTSHEAWVYVDDLDGHLAHAEAAGAQILQRKDWSHLPRYVALDLEGNRWTIAQARPTM